MNSGCLALARRHLFANPGDRLLEVGCGEGDLLSAVLNHEPDVQGAGVDLSALMLSEAHRRLGERAWLSRANPTHLPFVAQTFDWLVSTDTLHQAPEVAAALREWRRVLRSGGRLLLIEWSAEYLPTRVLWRWRRRRRPALAPMLRADALGGHLVDVGFDDIRIESHRVSPVLAVLVATARAAVPELPRGVAAIDVPKEQHRADP